MKKVSVDEAAAGMKLARPVENDSGMVLYGVGVQLTAQAVEKLRNLGVETVYVEGQGAVRFTPEAYRTAVDRAFSKAGTAPLTKRLKSILITHMESVYRDGTNS